MDKLQKEFPQIAAVVTIALVLMTLMPGCKALDNVLITTKTTPVVEPGVSNLVARAQSMTNAMPVVGSATNFTPVVENGVTNWTASVVTSTNWVFEVVNTTNWVWDIRPPSTNWVVTEVNANPAVESVLGLAGIIPNPYATTGASVLGLLLQGYVASRRKKMVHALTNGVEAYREELSPEEDAKLIEKLKAPQQMLGVQGDINSELRKQGLSKGAK